ncbi:MAG: hypothetical protein A2189_03240 [Paenibacillus sp. RIFOXYA1_FULL_44_5]|nr:MAG: hypothetical protein A2189_03240 [Paenibacillus sp. RIFOXYA1_FULL_44_5]
MFYNPDYVFEGSVSYDYGVEAGRMIASKREGITAVFATGDLVAFGVIAGLAEMGLKVPDDISVIGFDDISLAKMFVPRLTTIKQDITARGMIAAQSLLDAIEGKQEDSETLMMPIELVVRDTVRKI